MATPMPADIQSTRLEDRHQQTHRQEEVSEAMAAELTDSGHIPYRDSKLTHLLENALGGDSNICVICTLSGEEDHHAETLETLKFAGNCARVETKAKKNIASLPMGIPILADQ